MHILVTGASGFIGQVLTQLLTQQGHQVTAMSRCGCQSNMLALLQHDLGSGNKLTFPDGIEAVVHLAQSRSYREFPDDCGEMFRVNVLGTQEILNASADAGVSRFCLISSGTVYEPYARRLTEDAPLAPTSYLGASKLAAEIIARPFAQIFDLSVLRLFMPYGPGQVERLIPTLVKRIREGKAVTLPEKGDGMRFTPTHVDDICSIICAAVRNAWAGTYNVANPKSTTIRELAELIGKYVGEAVEFERKPIETRIVLPDLTRLEGHYDMRQLKSLETGLAESLKASSLDSQQAILGSRDYSSA